MFETSHEISLGAPAAPVPCDDPIAGMTQPTVKAGSLVLGANPRRGDRKKTNPARWAEFVASIKERGIIEPVVVRYIADSGQYQIVAGYGRLEGALEVHGADYDMPVRVIDGDDNDALAIALIENMQRDGMTPVEEAEGAARLLAEFAGNRDEVARRLGMSMPTLERRLALMNCSEGVRNALVDSRILLGHAELLAAAPKKQQDEVLAKLLALPAMIPVAALKGELQKVALPLANACFDKSECAACPHNSDLQTQMFGEAISAGNCTNRSCYDAKTEAEITARVERIKDDYPRVQIVRPGDNHTIIKIVAEGTGAVGAEQAQACRGCKDFGAAVSAVPGKEGRVFEDHCFNPACNARMVAKHIKSQQPAQEKPSKDGPAKVAGKPAAKTSASTTTAKASGVTGPVQEFRAKLWRDALVAEMASRPMNSFQLLVSIALTNNASKVSTDTFASSVKELGGISRDYRFDAMDAALTDVLALPKETLTACLVRLSGAAVKSLSDKAVCAALKAFEVDLAKHFRIDEVFLKLLTKSELEVVAKEVGLDKALGEAFAKLGAKKKDEMVKALLAAEGFDYAVAPRMLQPTL